MTFELTLQKAVEDLKIKENIYSLIDPNFQDVAYLELKAAESRVNAILKEVKHDVRNNLQRQC